MSQLLNFYSGEGTDSEGRRLDEILAWPDDQLEEVHDFIQWLFPLPEPSNFNPDAPLLSPSDVNEFHASPGLQERVRKSYSRFLTFLGLVEVKGEGEAGRVEEGPNFAARAPEVWAHPNHNWLRVSRLLRSLTLLGLASEARALYAWLEAQHRSGRYPIRDDTFGHWSRAVCP